MPRPAIDITLRWSEKQSRLPASLLWGFDVFVYVPPGYKHVAPLGLNAPMPPSIHFPTFPLSPFLPPLASPFLASPREVTAHGVCLLL